MLLDSGSCSLCKCCWTGDVQASHDIFYYVELVSLQDVKTSHNGMEAGRNTLSSYQPGH